MRLCFASNNKHKLEEIKNVVGRNINIVSLADIKCYEELPETRNTLEGNSLQKAEYVFQHYNTPCFADDTGLEVDALNGAPGVYSARYAGEQRSSEDNIALLLQNLKNDTNRKAQFRTVITLLGVEEKPLYFEGIIRGEIITEKRGTSGFGYDPIFIPEGQTKTFAEMSMDEKNQLSHRAIAVRKLGAYLSGITV
ncbi:non-canonical purine NTP diphosphatase [Ohtaekwangia koreensis]|uniref:dITP/XTP pyrophosphatase n=1 Tax=Ohtaekwangia koreensis TaxID=688867 RepID=A0A1T5LEB7_9BACT|nr:non-canonical purine NTP diphosphatase [Ohtaekwangia koreensis]SKC74045.1 XTP/dITP diphosphohydrolase [Ohtaekwangia koreensis]